MEDIALTDAIVAGPFRSVIEIFKPLGNIRGSALGRQEL